MEKVFVPHELKTIEVDVEKKIFRVNGILGTQMGQSMETTDGQDAQGRKHKSKKEVKMQDNTNRSIGFSTYEYNQVILFSNEMALKKLQPPTPT